MSTQLHITQAATAQLFRNGVLVPQAARGVAENHLEPRGVFKVELWRKGKRINEWVAPNMATNEGKNKLLNVMFDGATQITDWWIGLIDNSGYTGLAAGDTYVNINQPGDGWDEFTAYTDTANSGNATTRPAWTMGSATIQSITNGAPVIFDITSSGTVKGLFLVGGIANAQLKNNHEADGLLWATALFLSGDTAVSNGDQLKVTYTVNA